MKEATINPNELTEEQKAKVRACKSPEDILALAKEEGYELCDEELQAIAGGDKKHEWLGPECEGVLNCAIDH